MAPRYIGMDVHVQSTTIAVMGPSGRRIREDRVETNISALKGVLRGVGGEKIVAMEEGLLSTWLYEMLRHTVNEVVVFQPEKKQPGKNDSRDAWRIQSKCFTWQLDPYIYTVARIVVINKILYTLICRTAVFRKQTSLFRIVFQQTVSNGQITAISIEFAAMPHSCKLQADMLEHYLALVDCSSFRAGVFCL